MKDFNEKLTSHISSVIEESESEIAISPAFVAKRVLELIDPNSIAPTLVSYGCNLEIRQVARGILRKRFESYDEDGNGGQVEMFEGLQDRYPARRNGESVYVKRMDLVLDERLLIPQRLRQEAGEKLKHADAFEAETLYLMESGYFTEESATA
jgi:hypothetical protein